MPPETSSTLRAPANQFAGYKPRRMNAALVSPIHRALFISPPIDRRATPNVLAGDGGRAVETGRCGRRAKPAGSGVAQGAKMSGATSSPCRGAKSHRPMTTPSATRETYVR